jgi:hypothetical protein
LKVYVFPSDEWGVGHYRMIWPSQAVAGEGHCAVKVVPPKQDGGIGGWIGGGRLQMVWAPEDMDVVVMQRVTRGLTVEILRGLRQKGIATVVDVDDDLTCLDPMNPVFNMIHPKRNEANNWTWLQAACMEADLVTCSTPAIAKRFGAHGRTVVLENRVPAAFLDVPHADLGGQDPLFGWAGDLPTHPRDLSVLGLSFQRARAKAVVVGPPAWVPAWRWLGPRLEPATGEVPFGSWPHALAALDAGVAPLADTKFNEAKSWLKPLEYAAAGVPWIGSPTREYRRLSATVPGVLARSGREWERALRRLSDEAERKEMSAAGRDAVREHHVYEGNGWRWAEAWESALKRRRG